MSTANNNEIKIGSLIKASISSIKDFGAFADFDGGSGLIYYTKVVPKVDHGKVHDVLSEGQVVDAIITEIKADGKISLSMQIPRKAKRKALVDEVKQDLSTLSDNDTSIRSVWIALTKIEHYLLKYMQTPIMLKKGSAHLTSRNELKAQIDSSVHFETFKSEVKRIFSAEVLRHERLRNLWYFDADISKTSTYSRSNFAEGCSNMYVNLDSDPVVEIYIHGLSESGKALFLERMTNYYPQLKFYNYSNSSICIIISYKTSDDKEDLMTELKYALDAILNGNPDTCDDGSTKEYDKVSFTSEVIIPDDGLDRFIFQMDTDALLDNEGIRYGSLKGQNFITNDDTSKFELGILRKINYPNVEFQLNKECIERIQNLVSRGQLDKIFPDPDDMVGEFEKVNRLNDSFDRITEHPEELVNPKLASYLFDASKATPNDHTSILQRIEQIKACQLNKNLNDSQIAAIAKAVEAKDMALIQGPPGTGKSTAIAELIWQILLSKPNGRLLLTSEANLAVDNALDRIKFSIHNIIKPVRIASGDKLSTEGLSYSHIEMKKWADIKLSDSELADNSAAVETREHKLFDPKELVLNRWLRNIASRSQIDDTELKNKWLSFLDNPDTSFKQSVYYQYMEHCNVVGATCSAISDTNYTASEESKKHRDSRFLKRFRAVFGETDKSGRPTELFFNVVIQDEASKATPSELSLPLVYGEKAIIIGDHRQLPPNIEKSDILFKLHMLKLKSANADEQKDIEELERYVKKNFDILEKSHFERLFRQIDDSIKGTFDTQYRMHNDINKVIKQFYIDDGGLECGVKDEDRQHGISIPGLVTPNDHVIWIDTLTPELKEGTSRSNPGEVDAVKWVIDQLCNSDSFKEYQSSLNSDEDKEIGLISFYGAQMKLLNPVVESAKKQNLRIKLSSVDRFQGMERNIIIVSLVRSNIIASHVNEKPDFKNYPEYGYKAQTSFGFAESPNRLNVALSRAKRLLIIVGNGTHFCSFVNKEGKTIYKNVYDEIRQHPHGIIPWKTATQKNSNQTKVIRVPMPATRSINLNSRDINIEKDVNLRKIETWLTPDRQPIENPHYAILELSTKAVKLLYGRNEEAIKTATTFSFDNFVRETYKTETGQGLNNENVMDMRYFSNRVMPVIRLMKQRMKEAKIDVVYCVATAAYRTAKNRDEIIEYIRKEAGINVRILSKKEESIATMFAFGISSRYRIGIRNAKNSFMIEQGGGSTEVSVFQYGELLGSYSINIGTTTSRNAMFEACKDSPYISMAEALKRNDQIIKERMVAFMNNMGDFMKDNDEYFCVSVGTAITRATGGKKNAQQHDKVLTREMIEEKILSSTEKVCQSFKSIGEFQEWNQRVESNNALDGIVTMRLGLPLFIYFFDKFNVNEIHVCGTGLWYGIYFQKLFNSLDLV